MTDKSSYHFDASAERTHIFHNTILTDVCYNFPQMLKANTSVALKEDMTTSMIFETFVTLVDSSRHNI